MAQRGQVKMYLPSRTAQVLVRDSLLQGRYLDFCGDLGRPGGPVRPVSGGVKIFMDATFLVSYSLPSCVTWRWEDEMNENDGFTPGGQK